MSLNVYEPCPCESGKKLKFCCAAIAADMEKAVRLLHSNQPRLAMQILDTLQTQYPANPWVVTTRATVLLDEGHFQEAIEILKALLQQSPNHPLGMVLYASALLGYQGYANAKAAIARAFRGSVATHPEIVASLAHHAATGLWFHRQFMAARQHLAFALLFADEEERRDIFSQLIEIDGNQTVPYPLRGGHDVAQFTGSDEDTREFNKAMQLVASGCWDVASNLLIRLAESHPESAALRRNAGLCRAYVGDQQGAAKLLHEAARLEQDTETAIELETMAQILDGMSPERSVPSTSIPFRADSVSRLLSRLDTDGRFVRASMPEQEGEPEQMPAAMFRILDRPASNEPAADSGAPASESPTKDDIPCEIGRLFIFDRVEDEPNVFAVGLKGDELDGALECLGQAGGDALQAVPNDAEEENLDSWASSSVPRELLPLNWEWYMPPSVTRKTIRRLVQEEWRHRVLDVWPQIAMESLGGKTPLEARDDPSLSVPLAAAVYTLDAFCNLRGHQPDLGPVRELLHVAPPQKIHATPESDLRAFSAMELHRLDLADLSDEQLRTITNRAMLMRHGTFAKSVLLESLNRPALRADASVEMTYELLTRLCREGLEDEEALEWVEKGYQQALTQDRAFERTLSWKMRELRFRLDDPADPKIRSLVTQLRNQYASKVPELDDALLQILEDYGATGLQDLISDESHAGAMTDAGIWVPSAESATDSGPGKLWLPGSD